MSVKHIFLETMFDDFTPDSVSREELISILLDDLMVVARDNLSIEYLENGGDAEEALKLFSVEMRKNLEERFWSSGRSIILPGVSTTISDTTRISS